MNCTNQRRDSVLQTFFDFFETKYYLGTIDKKSTNHDRKSCVKG